jgi:hypothetical protein
MAPKRLRPTRPGPASSHKCRWGTTTVLRWQQTRIRLCLPGMDCLSPSTAGRRRARFCLPIRPCAVKRSATMRRPPCRSLRTLATDRFVDRCSICRPVRGRHQNGRCTHLPDHVRLERPPFTGRRFQLRRFCALRRGQSGLPADPGTIFQGDDSQCVPTSMWSPRTIDRRRSANRCIPDSIANGQLSIRIGLYDPQPGQVSRLVEMTTAQAAVLSATLPSMPIGSALRLHLRPPADPRINAAGSVVSFPTIQTDGMVSIIQEIWPIGITSLLVRAR